ncbi:MAG: AAA family ATPase, partial [Bdellovibrionia bacterium]
MNSNWVRLSGVVERVTYHNSENGWSVLKVTPWNEPFKKVTVVLHQAKVFAGSSMEFWGTWGHHPKHGEQFKAERALEKKPASAAALEKYLGSGLIQNVGPKTAAKIVRFFREKTLEVFEERIDELLQVPGIAERKLQSIKASWEEHKAIRDVMLFLQSYGISTLFAVKIYKAYGNDSISLVSQNPYQLARDIHGIGFFSADQIALSLGFEPNGVARIEAGIQHVLAASREEGHCYLTQEQILKKTTELLQVPEAGKIETGIQTLLEKNEIKARRLCQDPFAPAQVAYYSNSLYFDEQYVAQRIQAWIHTPSQLNLSHVHQWIEAYCEAHTIRLSPEQKASVIGITQSSFSILTGGPGCGKTTTTQVLVQLLEGLNQRVLLAAPTGRASQRMSEVIGRPAKTIHRLLEVNPTQGGFKKNEQDPLQADFIIVDECSMLDIHLTAALLRAIPQSTQVLFIGDPDQLPSVGAGNVLFDLISCQKVTCFRLTQVFRQANESLIIRFAHQINQGQIPEIHSPIHRPTLWQEKMDCLFVDSEEATQAQLQFLKKAKAAIQKTVNHGETQLIQTGEKLTGVMRAQDQELQIERLLIQEFQTPAELHQPIFVIPEKFKHVDLERVHHSLGELDQLKCILQTVHPWSALHYGLSSVDVILRLVTKT